MRCLGVRNYPWDRSIELASLLDQPPDLNIFLAPVNDLRNNKIVPCEVHRQEFGCKTFCTVFTNDIKVTATEEFTDDGDIFRFALTDLDPQQHLINFQVC